MNERIRNRLRRIEGQVRGLQRMIEEERACNDILIQVSSVRQALLATGCELLRAHVVTSIREASLQDGTAAAATYT